LNKKNLVIAAAARLKDRSLLRAAMAAAIVAGLLALAALPAQAQRIVSIGGLKRTATVAVNIGKTEDVRTDASFVDLQVGDPEVADVNPLTDKSLSILGRKSGTTRVTAYGENKKLIGVFDVEVSHDTSMLASTLSKRFPYAKMKVAAVNGRILIIVDSGFRRGSDVFKALALGANAVELGRAARWGLGAFGAAGTQRVIEILPLRTP